MNTTYSLPKRSLTTLFLACALAPAYAAPPYPASIRPVGVATSVNTPASVVWTAKTPDSWIRWASGYSGIGFKPYPAPTDPDVWFFSLSNADGSTNSDATYRYFPTGGFGKLKDIRSLSYQWYRQDNSTDPLRPEFAPMMVLLINTNGDGTTVNGRLFYDPAANHVWTVAPNTAPTNSWQTESITTGSQFWFYQDTGAAIKNEGIDRPLSVYQSGNHNAAAGWTSLSPDDTVIGISFNIGGSAGIGSFSGAVRSPVVISADPDFPADSSKHRDFGVTPFVTPGPQSIPTLELSALLALSGVLGVGASLVARRRRTNPS